MKTRIISPSQIQIAADILRAGGLVAFPTETVYGLGANALDSDAVSQIFVAKGRPQDNPLIVHVATLEQLYSIVQEVPPLAEKLIKKFWPGPLTIVLKKANVIPSIVTAGLDSVAVRMPSNKIALELIKGAGVPIAAPSANVSGKPSPTTARHVVEDLFGRVDVIIDGGDCEVGVESTVVSLIDKPELLRPGKITLEELRSTIGDVIYNQNPKVIRSPGMKHKHYAPNAKVIISNDVAKLSDEYFHNGKKVGVIATKAVPNVEMRIVKNVTELAKHLFQYFREFDSLGTDVIIVEPVEKEGLGLAVMNRLEKAVLGT